MYTQTRLAHRQAWSPNSANTLPRRKTWANEATQTRAGDINHGFSTIPDERPLGPATVDLELEHPTTDGNTNALLSEQTAKPTQVDDDQTSKGTQPEREIHDLASTESSESIKHKSFTWGNQLKATLFRSWINVLLFAAPIGVGFHYADFSPKAVFVVNFLAIIPLAALLSQATEEIALRIGEIYGGLLNATFGNAVELIVSIIALTKGDVLIVKTSLIGSILSNLLLVTGMCFFLGGFERPEQFFNETAAGTAASLLAAAVSCFIIPTAFNLAASTDKSSIPPISRGMAIILLVVYGCYLLFQLKTHANAYNQESRKVRRQPWCRLFTKFNEDHAPASISDIERQPVINNDLHEPELHICVAIIILVASTAVVGLCSEFMVGSIESFTATTNVSAKFIGLILLPIVGNAVEHMTAVKVACKDRMDLAISVAVGSSMQIALLVIPFVTVVGWAMGNDDMTLSFDIFQIVILFVSVWVVNYLISDGKSNWLEGVLLMCLYLTIAVTAWFYPTTSLTGQI